MPDPTVVSNGINATYGLAGRRWTTIHASVGIHVAVAPTMPLQITRVLDIPFARILTMFKLLARGRVVREAESAWDQLPLKPKAIH